MRDLSKPVGALEPQRLQALLKRMKEIQVNHALSPIAYGVSGVVGRRTESCWLLLAGALSVPVMRKKTSRFLPAVYSILWG